MRTGWVLNHLYSGTCRDFLLQGPQLAFGARGWPRGMQRLASSQVGGPVLLSLLPARDFGLTPRSTCRAEAAR